MVGTIPGFKIVREIGKGGMSTVYHAIQESTGREVALKVLSPHLMGSPIFSQRLQKVAEIISSLTHPNVVAVYDAGQAMQAQYLAMEFIPNGDLKSKLDGKEEITGPLLIIQQVAKALAYVHSQNYIHRDIKPENILLRQNHSVAITGFGIAMSLDPSQPSPVSPGMIVGTPAYMSPEQAMDREITARSDIYSLGVVLFEVLTGRPLYTGISSVAAAVEHASHPIPQLPEPHSKLQSLLEKMVAKDPNERFVDADAVVDAIEPLLEGTPTATPIDEDKFEPRFVPPPAPEPAAEPQPTAKADAKQTQAGQQVPQNFVSLGEALSNRPKQQSQPPSEQTIRMERMERVRQQEQSALESLKASDPDLFQFDPPDGESELEEPEFVEPEPGFDFSEDINQLNQDQQRDDTVVMNVPNSLEDIESRDDSFGFELRDADDPEQDEMDFHLRDIDVSEVPHLSDSLPDLDQPTPTPISDTPYNGPTKQPKYSAPQKPESTIVGVIRQFPAALIIIAVVILVPAIVIMQMQGSPSQTPEPTEQSSEKIPPVSSATGSGEDIENLVATAQANEKAGRLQQATQGYQQIVELDPKNEEAKKGLTRVAGTYLERAYAAVMDHKDLAGAQTAMAMAKKLEPDHPDMNQVQSQIEKLDAELKQQQEQKKRIQPEIDALLSLAAKAMVEGRLVDPPGDSADDYYSRLLVVDENNPDAIAGLQKISDYYSDALTKAVREKNLSYAQSYLDSLRKTAPQHPRLPEFEAAIKELALLPRSETQATTAGNATTAESPPTSQTGSQTEQMQSLLAKAQYAMDRDQLMFPQNDNAYDYYVKALNQAPSNPQALDGLSQIAKVYLRLSSRALNNDDLSLASAYANRSYDIVKTHNLDSELRQEVEEMRAVIYRITFLK